MTTYEDRIEGLAAAPATRRFTLGSSLKLAFATPAVVAALQSGVAHADSKGGSKGTKGTRAHDTGTHTGTGAHNVTDANKQTGTSTTPSHMGTGTGTLPEVAGLQQLFSGKVRRLSGDVDRLKHGSLKLFGVNGQATRLFVRLKDAASNVQYRVVHVATNGAVTVLGVVTSNNSGDFRGVLTLNPAFVLPLENGKLTGTLFLQRDAGGGNFVNQYTVRRVNA